MIRASFSMLILALTCFIFIDLPPCEAALQAVPTQKKASMKPLQPRCHSIDRILLSPLNRNEETMIKVKMIPGLVTALALYGPDAKRFDEEVKAFKPTGNCAQIFGHGIGGEVAGYSYDRLKPLFDKYKRIDIFACGQDPLDVRSATVTSLITSRAESLMRAEGHALSNKKRSALQRYWKPTVTRQQDSAFAYNFDFNSQTDPIPTLHGALEQYQAEAERQAEHIISKVFFSSPRVVNLFPCVVGGGICAWISLGHQDIPHLQAAGLPGNLDVAAMGLKLSYPRVVTDQDYQQAARDLQNQVAEKKKRIETHIWVEDQKRNENVKMLLKKFCKEIRLSDLY